MRNAFRIIRSLSIWAFVLLVSIVLSPAAHAAPGDIHTLAGGVALDAPNGIHVTPSGEIYLADTFNHRVVKIGANGAMTSVAGNGVRGAAGDGGPAAAANLDGPMNIALDNAGNLYIADIPTSSGWIPPGIRRVRKVDANGGISSVIAGTGSLGGNACSRLATDSYFNDKLQKVLVDRSGRLHVIAGDLWRLEDNGTLTNWSDAACGNGWLQPGFMTGYFDANSGAFIYWDADLHVIFATDDFQASVIVGNDVGASSIAYLDGDRWNGNILVAKPQENKVYQVRSPSTTIVLAGTGTAGYSGDGGYAMDAQLNGPAGASVDQWGNVYIVDRGNNAVRKVEPALFISTVWGSRETGSVIPASSARFKSPRGVFSDASGNVYIADTYDHLVRKIDPTGTVSTIAGNGSGDFCGDGGPAVDACLFYPSGVYTDPAGNVYIADTMNDRVRKVDTSGIITTVTGTGMSGYSGDGGPAADAVLNAPTGIAMMSTGELFISDSANNVVRYIDTMFGNMMPYYFASQPHALAVDSQDALYIASRGDGIRKRSGGTFSSVPSCADATGVAVDFLGNVYAACPSDNVVMQISANGSQVIVAGTGIPGFSGDGGTAIGAVLSSPWSVSIDPNGALSVADAGNDRVRRVEGTSGPLPSVTISSPNAGLTNNNSPLLTYTVSSGTAVVKVDGSVVNKFSGNNLDPLGDGLHTVRIEATDQNGTGFAERTFVVDTVAPVVTITSPAAGVTKDKNPMLIYTVSDGTVVVKVDGVIVPTVSGNILDIVAEGSHVVRVESTDAAGNSGFSEVTFIVDTIAPSVSIASPIAGATNNNHPVLTYTASDGAVVVKVDGIIIPKVSGNTLDILAEGSHTVRVESTDAAGNTGFEEVTFTVDTTAPTINLSSPSAGATRNNTPLLTYTAGDGTVIVKVDGAIVSKMSGNNLDVLSDGTHTVRVESTDAAGNLGFAEATFVVDTVPPAVGVSPVITPTNVNPQSITGTRESGAVITVALNTGATAGAITYPTDTTWSCTVNGLVEGANTVTATATDPVGNNAAAQTIITYDSIAPVVTISSPAVGSTNNNRPILTYAASDGAVVVKVDGNVVQKVSGNTLDALSDGVHVVGVESTDQAGNAGFAEVSFTVDKVAPAVVISSPISGLTKINAPLLTYTAGDGAVIVKVDGVIVPKVSGNSLDALADGTHTVRVESTDAAGNIGFAQVSLTVDTIAPAVTISAVVSPTNVSSQTISGTRENDAAIAVSVNTAASAGSVAYPTATTWSCAISGLSAGGNIITVAATDIAGNGANSVTSITLDIAEPTVTITSPVPGSTNNRTPLLSFAISDGTVIVKVDGAVVNKVSGNNLDPLTDGPHTVRVEAIDAAGNIGSSSITFTVDTVAPVVTMNSVTSPTKNRTQTVTGTRETGSTVTVNVNTSATVGTVTYPASTSWRCTISNMATGVNTVTASAKDAAGNTASASRNITVK